MRTNWKVVAAALVAVGLAAASGRAAAAKSEEKDETRGPDLFAQPKVLRFKIELSSAAQETLRKDPKTYVKAAFREGSQTLADIGVRLKGGGSFHGLDSKPSLALKFNEFVSGQKLQGQSKILLDNARQDPSYLCEAIGGEAFRAAGVPAARVTFARVELNGKDAGLYVVSEAANRDFLAQHFKKSKGNLYEGSNTDVTDKLEKDSGDASTDQPDVRALANAVKEADPAQRWRKLNALLDVDRFVSFAAAEVFTWHRDGYSMDRNSYRLYHDPASGLMVFMAHGLDALFTPPDGSLAPEWKGLVAKAVLETPEGQKRYRERMTQLLAETWTVDKLHERVNALAAAIRPAVGEQDSSATKAFDTAVEQLRRRIAQRVAHVNAQLTAKK